MFEFSPGSMVTKDKRNNLVAVIDAGTRTVKFCIFRSQHSTELVGYAVDIKQRTPQEGWLEVDPNEILEAIKACVKVVAEELVKIGKFRTFVDTFIRTKFCTMYRIFDCRYSYIRCDEST